MSYRLKKGQNDIGKSSIHDQKTITIRAWNARGIKNKREEVEDEVNGSDVFGVSEHMLKESERPERIWI